MEGSYGAMLKNPLRVASHKARYDEDERQATYMLERNRGALPRWPEDRFVLCDKMALHYGKRCVLWDDDASGFYLWMHWDWAANRPAKVDPDDKRSRGPGWYQNLKEVFTAPLLDVSVGEERLAEWIDANTMRCHANLLQLLQHLKRAEPGAGAVWKLDDPYQAALDARPFDEE